MIFIHCLFSVNLFIYLFCLALADNNKIDNNKIEISTTNSTKNKKDPLITKDSIITKETSLKDDSTSKNSNSKKDESESGKSLYTKNESINSTKEVLKLTEQKLESLLNKNKLNINFRNEKESTKLLTEKYNVLNYFYILRY